MNTRDFLAHVLPTAPSYVLTLGRVKEGGMQFWNRNYSDLDALAVAALQHDKSGLTVYFALAAFTDNEAQLEGGRTKVERKAAQAREFRALACDIDVGEGKPYPDQRAAATALAAACKALALPPPMVVSSGRGLHCYWPLTADLEKSKWVITSQALRAAFAAKGLAVDQSKICDPSMVLRPVGTTNRKGGDHPVRVLRDCASYDYDALSALLTEFAVATPQGVRKTSALMAAVLSTDLPPADPFQIALRCNQLKIVAETGGAQASEPMWYATIGVAAFCENPEETAIAWSSGHANFDEKETLAKLTQWRSKATGPTTCARFEQLDAGGCATCPHKGKITAPTQLSIPKKTTIDMPHGEVKLPRGYRVSGKRIVRVVEDEVIPVCNVLMYVRDRYFNPDEGKMVCELVVHTHKEGEKVVMLPIDVLAAGGEKLTSFFYNNNVAPGPYDAYVKNTRQYLMSYLEELQGLIQPTESHNTFGWVLDDTAFILGPRKYTKDGVHEIQLASTITTDVRDAYVSKGELSEWVALTKHFDARGLEFHAMCLLIGMGTPLYKFTTLDGCIVSMYSPESGTGKSTTGQFISSVWGHPKTIQIGRNDTINALYHSIAQQNNLPAYCEEITNISPQDFSNLAYNVSVGRGRRRMNERAELRRTERWSLVLFTSTNQSLIAKLQLGKLSSEGELHRLIEYPFRANTVFDDGDGASTGQTIIRELQRNFGLAGPLLLEQYLKINNYEKVLDMASEAIYKHYKFTFLGQERFVQALYSTALVAAKIAHRAGLISFDYNRVFEVSLAYVDSLRDTIKSGTSTAFDIIGNYVAEVIGDTIIQRNNLSTGVHMFVQPMPRQSVVARIELYHDKTSSFLRGAAYFSAAKFNQWCFDHGVDASTVLDELRRKGVQVGRLRMTLSRGTPIVTTSIPAISIDLTHPEFGGVMDHIEGPGETKLHLVN